MMPDTYFEFTLGYLIIWTILFLAIAWGLVRQKALQKQMDTLKQDTSSR